MNVGLVIVAVIIVLLIVVILMYNNLVQLRNRVDNAWAQVDVQLQRRLDLVPSLIEVVKGYAAHESETLQNVTDARAAVMGAKNFKSRYNAEKMLDNTLKSLFAVSERYPELVASKNFVNLQNQLSDTEDKISYMRQSYNDTVMKYNNAIETFPGSFFAAVFNFEKRNSFDAAFGADIPPQIQF